MSLLVSGISRNITEQWRDVRDAVHRIFDSLMNNGIKLLSLVVCSGCKDYGE